MADTHPRIEVLLLGGLGALLILVNGIALLVLSTAQPASIQFTNDVESAGAASVFEALLLALFLVLYWVADQPGVRGVWAALIAMVGALSLWSGGGFLVGLVLTLTAGVVGILLARPVAVSGYPPLAAPPVAPPSDSSPMPPLFPAPAGTDATLVHRGRVVWFCPKCDSENPIDSRVCGNCGTTIRARS
jgi:hypothetical protein